MIIIRLFERGIVIPCGKQDAWSFICFCVFSFLDIFHCRILECEGYYVLLVQLAVTREDRSNDKIMKTKYFSTAASRF